MKKKTITMQDWMIMKSRNCDKSKHRYDSEEKAIEIGRTTKNYVATIKIEWEADE